MLHFTKLDKAITPLLRRVIVFACLFIIVSGIIGPRIISGDILLRDGFVIYGGIGKALLFSIIAFVLLARRFKDQIKLQKWQPKLIGWIVAAFFAFILAWISVDSLLAGVRSLQNLLLAHGALLLCIGCIAIGCIGPKNIGAMWGIYKREIIWSVILGIAFYIFLHLVYGLWQPFASIVLTSVEALLNASGLETTVLPPHTLLFDKFGITVAESCSGVESIALFTSLYAIVGLLDWDRLNKRRYLIIFPFALLALFILNILRVYSLIMAGYFINAEIAFSLFHTYAGMVFFIFYSAIFWLISYKYMIKKKPNTTNKVLS